MKALTILLQVSNIENSINLEGALVVSPFEKAVLVACQEPTLLDALEWICAWESNRAVKVFAQNQEWDTCFKLCLSKVMDSYKTPIKGSKK